MERRLFFKTEEVRTTTVKGYVDVDMDYTQVYHNLFKYAAKVRSPLSFKYLIWLLKRMGKTNFVTQSDAELKSFLKELKESWPECDYGIGTVKNCASELVREKLLIKIGHGAYQLNAELFWSEATGDRKKYLTDLKKLSIENGIIVEEKYEDYGKE